MEPPKDAAPQSLAVKDIEMLISSGRIKWILSDIYERTIFHLAVQKNNMRHDKLKDIFLNFPFK